MPRGCWQTAKIVRHAYIEEVRVIITVLCCGICTVRSNRILNATVMSSSVAHAQSTNPWGSSSTSAHPGLGSSLTDTFGQSRTHYQPGYMMVSRSTHSRAPPSATLPAVCPTTQCTRTPKRPAHRRDTHRANKSKNEPRPLSRWRLTLWGRLHVRERFDVRPVLFPASTIVDPLIHAANARLSQTRMHHPRRPSMTCFGSHPLARRRGGH